MNNIKESVELICQWAKMKYCRQQFNEINACCESCEFKFRCWTEEWENEIIICEGAKFHIKY